MVDWRRNRKKSDSPQEQDCVMNCYFPVSIHFPSGDQRSRKICFPPPWSVRLGRGDAALAFGLKSPEIR